MTDAKHTPEQITDADLDQTQGAGRGSLLAASKGSAYTKSQDKLGNFEIQDLMSRFNQAESTASSVQKKTDDTANSVIGKV
ncbi:MAG: hypothetical protein AAGC81_17640 [Pseudomonadota bacterium]